MFSVILDSVVDDNRLIIRAGSDDTMMFEIEGRNYVDSVIVDRDEVVRTLIAIGEREID